MLNSKKLLITRPNHDIITHYLHEWSKNLVKEAKNRGMDVIDLDGENVNKTNFESHVKNTDPKLMVLNGHGNEKTVCGHKDLPILQKGENVSLVKNKILYVRSCASVAELGKDSTENKEADVFIGYEDDFVIIRDTRKTAHPQRDEAAKPIIKSSNKVAKNLIKGRKAREAYKRSQESYMKEMKKILAGYTLGKRDIFNALATNRENQVILGNGEASLDI